MDTVDNARERQCGTKIIYPEQEYADRAAKNMHKKYKAKYQSYPCQWCNGFHVGRIRSLESGIRRWERLHEKM